ncbi:hypothetical protein NWT09_24125 [Mycolicibacterium sp. jd]|uniref:hypothetical protein n=1 Tax=unclassified Mycolicibacterium TaxID=2636767 RepID=UPI00351B2C12
MPILLFFLHFVVGAGQPCQAAADEQDGHDDCRHSRASAAVGDENSPITRLSTPIPTAIRPGALTPAFIVSPACCR